MVRKNWKFYAHFDFYVKFFDDNDNEPVINKTDFIRISGNIETYLGISLVFIEIGVVLNEGPLSCTWCHKRGLLSEVEV